ncbi:MAG: hypothetical protein VB064_12835 [Oscillospiraceae bacterium]|nr:hypothetical protein [Oscillospiraceae bacterium]
MIKKAIVLALVLIGAFIMVPCGFGLWNENVGVHGQIIFAERAPEAPEQTQSGEEIPLTDNAAENNYQSDNGQGEVVAEPSGSDAAQLEPTMELIPTSDIYDNGGVEETAVPLPDKPVEAVDSPLPAQVPSEEAGDK